jgi:Na+/H+ antiporter
MCTAITRRDDIIENLPDEYKPKMQALKNSREEYTRLRDVAMTAAQHEVLSAQDRYDPNDVYRVIRKLDILSQADTIRSNNNFVLPAMPAGAVALERYRLLREHLGTSSIPLVENAPSSPLVTSVDSREKN